jgi:hypothetical protein
VKISFQEGVQTFKCNKILRLKRCLPNPSRYVDNIVLILIYYSEDFEECKKMENILRNEFT